MILCTRCGRELPDTAPARPCPSCRPPSTTTPPLSQLERTVATAAAIGRGRVTRRGLHLARELLARAETTRVS